MARKTTAYMIRNLAAKAGLVIGRVGTTPSWEYAFQQLRKAGVFPQTVFDIGVAQGTPWLYSAFPNATFHLIDPTRESVPYMEKIAKQYNASIHNVALGDDQDGQVEIKVRRDIAGSTLFEEVGDAKIAARYIVPMRRFSQIIDGFDRPALAKIDVQGAEMLVLRGMTERLVDLDVIIIEVSIIATCHGGPELAEVVSFLTQQGWVVADIVSLVRRPLDGALAQVDLLFVPNSSPLRRDKRWAG